MKRLRELRKKQKISMRDFGKLFGLAESTISLYETGKRQPDNEMLLKFANFFNVSVDYLLGNEQKEKAVGNNANSPDPTIDDAIKILKNLPPDFRAHALDDLRSLAALVDKHNKK